MKLFELVTRKEGLEFLAWRRVPVDPDAVGQKARDLSLIHILGVLPCAPDNILMKDRLRPGKMLLVDTVKGGSAPRRCSWGP